MKESDFDLSLTFILGSQASAPSFICEGGEGRIRNGPREFRMVQTSVSLASIPNMPLIFNFFFSILLTVECACMLNLFSCVQFFVTLWTLAPPALGFSRQKYWSGLPCPLQEIFQTQGSNQHLLHWQAGSLPLAPSGKPTVEVGSE